MLHYLNSRKVRKSEKTVDDDLRPSGLPGFLHFQPEAGSTLLYIILLLICHFSFAQQPPVIPLPNQYSKVEGIFVLSSSTPVVAVEPSSQKIANFLQKKLLSYTGLAVSVQSESKMPAINLKLNAGRTARTNAYTLEMNTKAINITASSDEGLFNGVISLLQMARKTPVKNASVALSCWNIADAARYAWRGFMLDESRHFFGKEKVKSILDWMAFYKLNRFHWHLTDEPGWRLEIKQYPKLGLIGGIGNFTDKNAPAKYYTQEDINEIVNYASERYISIIPEFDMPGHGTASNRAYPEFSGGGNEAHPEFTFNPGKTEVYGYLTNIIKEADALFPSQMIHIGGDEVSFGTEKWNTDADIMKLMQTNGLKDLKEVENYFDRRIADSVIKLNNKVLAWDEASGAGLPVDKTIIIWWRHDKPDQLKVALDRGYPVVLSPRLPMYFDFVQDSIHKFGRRWQGHFNTLENVYGFSHDQIPEASARSQQILGIQANLWTETLGTEERLDYLLFPRICALAEAAWTQTSKKDFRQFNSRLLSDIELFRKEGIYYFDPNAVNSHSEPPAPDRQ
jgi:hexosaminidase